MNRLLLITLVTTSFSGVANANNGVYASLKAGISDTRFKNYELTDTFASGTRNDYYGFESENKNTYPNISTAIGFDFSKVSKVNVRTELEYTHKDKITFNPENPGYSYGYGNFEFDTKIKIQALMLNSYYDFKNKSQFTPYVGLGMGVSQIKYENTVNFLYSPTSYKDDSFTWSANIGIAYNITNNVALDASYRYVDIGEIKIDQSNRSNEKLTGKADLSSQDYSLGIRYNF